MQELSDQLLGRPAEHLLRAGVGKRRAALAVDQEQCLGRVAGDGVGQVELVLEQLVRLLLLGVVPDDLGQPVQRAARVPQTDHDPVGPEAGAVLPQVPS